MSKSVNRKNNCTVHFMVNEEDMKELNRRFAMTNFKSKREFSSLISRNSANLNQIAKAVNTTGIIYKDDIESIKKALQGELLFLSGLREKVSDYIINEVIS